MAVNQYDVDPKGDAKIAELASVLGSQSAAARKLGVSKAAVQNACRRHLERSAAVLSLDRPKADPLPPFDLPFAERLALMKKRNALRSAHGNKNNAVVLSGESLIILNENQSLKSLFD